MIFIDTGAFLARYVAQDQHHRRARTAWREIEKRRERCLTSNFVLDEAFTLLARRATYSFAAERALAIYSSEVLAILRPELDDEKEAIELFRRFADQRVSFTDCISFVLMRRHRLTRAFSFDSHFERAGFIVWP